MGFEVFVTRVFFFSDTELFKQLSQTSIDAFTRGRDRLLRGARPDQREAIVSGARLADPRAMGVLFKALSLASSGLASPPPFGEI